MKSEGAFLGNTSSSPAYALHWPVTVRFKVSTMIVGAGLERQGRIKDNFSLYSLSSELLDSLKLRMYSCIT